MKTTSKFIIWLGVDSLSIVIWIALSAWSLRQIEETAEARKNTFVLLDKANHLLSTLKDAKTGQRGYILTGDEAFLSAYLSARGVIINDLNALRQHTSAHIPVVALSANAIPHDIEKGLKAGFFRYLTKPINVDELLGTLDVALAFSKSQKNRNKNEVETK